MDIQERAHEWTKYYPRTLCPFTSIPIGRMWEIMELAENSPPGCLVQIGTKWGGSAWMLSAIASLHERKLYLCGPFGETTAEEMSKSVPVGEIITNPQDIPEPIAFALLREPCEEIDTLMVSGGVIVNEQIRG